jgi:hypothetical protein
LKPIWNQFETKLKPIWNQIETMWTLYLALEIQ